ncbi:MAG: acetyl/propionyl/methylcrotonyl-CoA carboxylase subunit alpha [Alphaproteobacteria bacterium]|nr:acetyl/propionyl/methylcrotonyl-CoA carboxylase subunit alpha [Alphaproteobacteria bacterium]
MFEKILVANRGEIACRIMRTARRMGIKTVAVHSEADVDSLHVQMADEAVFVGPPPSAQSYLVVERIVEAARKTGAQAVHPGFGFLSEKAIFAEALRDQKIAFIGPSPEAIGAMGDKIESKKLAKKAGVSSVPGSLDVVQDDAHAVKIADAIGYPVMIKASAGGGGKGMRIAWNAEEARLGFRSATSEAKSSFADGRVFIEKYVDQPRHIEIQVLGDAHGNTLYLHERECSIQRRHQKVIEEAPSPFLDAATRKAMGEQAVALAKAVNYSSAGTVEFIVDGQRNFYFLEMNTRLQVEHPVTELITGLDIVEWMIRIAAGERLPFKQKDVKLDGWAVEARLYAEDATRGFVPAIGRLARYLEPPQDPKRGAKAAIPGGGNGADPLGAGVRCDSGVDEGSEISMYYDPMIAKLCAWGETREQAIDRLRTAMDAYVVRGLTHNLGFLSVLLGMPRFRAGKLTTKFIEEEFPQGFHGAAPTPAQLERIAAVAVLLEHRIAVRDAGISGQLAGHEAKVPAQWVVRLAGAAIEASAKPQGEALVVTIAGRARRVESAWTPADPLFRGGIDGVPLAVQVERQGIGFRLFHDGVDATVQVLTPEAAAYMALMPEKRPPDTSRFLLSPMPGLLLSLAVKPGDTVKAGQAMAVVEAMKMENVLRAERDGVVATLHAAAGDSLSVDQKIVEFAAPAGAAEAPSK